MGGQHSGGIVVLNGFFNATCRSYLNFSGFLNLNDAESDYFMTKKIMIKHLGVKEEACPVSIHSSTAAATPDQTPRASHTPPLPAGRPPISRSGAADRLVAGSSDPRMINERLNFQPAMPCQPCHGSPPSREAVTRKLR